MPTTPPSKETNDTPQTDPRRVVLFVDDEPDILELMDIYLEESLPGVQILIANDGPEGLAILRDTEVDLVVSDFRMPLMDGIEFLVEVRKM